MKALWKRLVEFGMDPIGVKYRVFDAAIGRLYFGRWLDKSLAALEQAAAQRRSPA
jgi:hypothetical protein